MPPYVIVLIIVGAILGMFVVSHFIVSYLIFRKYFGRRSEKVINDYFLYSHNYDSVRDILIKNKTDLETREHSVVETSAYDGIKLAAYYFPNNSEKTVIFFHGHHANPTGIFGYHAMAAINRGYNVLVVHERAHFSSGGKYSTFGFREQHDVLTWIDYVKNQYNCKSIYLYGMSMGATSICLASPKFDNSIVKAMVVDAAFPSLTKLIKQLAAYFHVPAFAFLWTVKMYAKIFANLSFNSFDTSESLQFDNTPTLFIHATNDTIAIESFFKDNYDKCSSLKKDKLIIKDGYHAISVVQMGEEALNKIFDFYRKAEE